MSNMDVISGADLARHCDCHHHCHPEPPHFPHCDYPPYPPVYWGVPFPFYPPKPDNCPPPNGDDTCPDCNPDGEGKKNATEAQICKLSRKAATLNKMLSNLNTKKKDVIIKIGDASFNFANIDTDFEGWIDDSYAATVQKIIEHQRALIQAEIKKLAEALDDDDTSNSSTDAAIGGTTG